MTQTAQPQKKSVQTQRNFNILPSDSDTESCASDSDLEEKVLTTICKESIDKKSVTKKEKTKCITITKKDCKRELTEQIEIDTVILQPPTKKQRIQ